MTSASRARVLVPLLALTACSTSATAPTPATDAGAADVSGSPDVFEPTPRTWSAVAEGRPGGALLSIWASEGGDVWLAGGELETPLVRRLTSAGTWEAHDPGTGQQAWWVHGFEGGEVVVVGDGGMAGRWDGEAWTAEPAAPAGATLYGVWGDAPQSLWAAGGPFLLGGEPVGGDVLVRYEAGSWTSVALPADVGERPGQSLFKVWGSGPADVYVVGSGGLILRFDGATWTREPVAEVESLSLFTVSGRGPDDVWAIGGGARAVLLRRQAGAWAEVDLPELPPQLLQGLWTAPGAPVLVSGAYGFAATLDEGGWTLEETGTGTVLHAIWGADAAGAAWAVGGSILTLSATYTGTALVAGREVPPLGADPLPDLPDVQDDDVPDIEADVAPDVPDVSDVPDVGPEVPCGAPDEACPEETKPYPGAPCIGELVCSYPNGDWSIDHFTCGDGIWLWDTECFVPGCAAIPPVSESCTEPFGGHLPPEGITVALGPAVDGADFVAFEPGDPVAVEWGPQGIPMMSFRVAVTGADELDCVLMWVTATVAEIDIETSMHVSLRCGESLRVYLLLPIAPLECSSGELFDVTLSAIVSGVGSAEATVGVEGGGAPWCD